MWAPLAFMLKAIAFAVVSYGANELIRRRADPDSPDPAGTSDVEAPTVEEGRPVPVLWGTCKLASPNVLWYGELHYTEMENGGYKYHLNMMWGWCHGPVDAIESLLWDDLEAPVGEIPEEWGDPVVEIPYPIERATTPAPSVWVNAGVLFGGNDQEGGVRGRYDFHWGTSDQGPDPELASYVGVAADEFPGYRGLCYSVAKTHDWPGDNLFYQGTSPYMKAHAMVARRCPNPLGLTGGAEDIDGNANPACMLYELLTDATWGLRYDPALIGIETFVSAGETLAAEGFGLSMAQDAHGDGRAIAREILRHIDGVLYKDRATGLLCLGLIRADYYPEEIVQLGDESIIEVESFIRPGGDALPNKILLSYVDRDQHFVEKVATAVDLSGVQARGRTIPQDVKFLGINNAEIAQKVAARELKAASYPFAGLSLKVNRAAWSLRPGSVFRISYAPLGITGMVCRVVKISYGTIADGAIRIEAIEDAFGVDWTAYSPPQLSGWMWPLQPPGS